MARQFPCELYIGQKVLVRPSPSSYAVESLVIAIDAMKGIVQVKPIGYNIRWIARPRAIANLAGLYLHYENERFFFDVKPFFA
ncbi:hypothetical protein G4Y79_07975 [Phototrophicus methaneseepsis]|uniref:Uncharacterized protein n=1 Tax=Phototrophicus methaneseepsis TaxID=2710758 RepID=A0A7S8IF36_9CHLR|nr:hypothetical protein [Phototrophicus methaneseepsis]QPC84300.1 hypothetical protein G4Y79_07975 [Phototrophicus methaneseepsis]